MIRKLIVAIALTMGLVVAPATTAEASTRDPVLACTYFLPHSGDTLTLAYSYFYQPGVVEIFRCIGNHPGTTQNDDHYYRVYRYSDGSWSWDPGW